LEAAVVVAVDNVLDVAVFEDGLVVIGAALSVDELAPGVGVLPGAGAGAGCFAVCMGVGLVVVVVILATLAADVVGAATGADGLTRLIPTVFDLASSCAFKDAVLRSDI